MSDDQFRPVAGTSHTINHFCKLENISRAMLYKLWGEGKGPRYYNVGTHRRITEDARREWQRQLEATTSKKRNAGAA